MARRSTSSRPIAGRNTHQATDHFDNPQRGLIDEIDLHIAPVLLGDGIRLFNPGGALGRLDRVHDGAPDAELSVRFRAAPRHPVGMSHRGTME